MKTFLQWAEDQQLELPVITDTPPQKKTSSENRIRTGMTQNYPPLYGRGQYPELWQVPHKATAILDFQQKPAKGYKGPKVAN